MSLKSFENRFITRYHMSMLLLLTLLVLRFLPFYIEWMVLVIACGSYVVRNNERFHFHSMPGGIPFIMMMLLGCVQGIIGYANKGIELWPYLRDLIYVSYVFLLWLAADIVGSKAMYDMRTLYVTLFLYSGISAFYGLVMFIPKVLGQFNTESVNFTQVKAGEYLISIGLYLSIFKPLAVGKHYLSNKMDFILRVLIMIGFLFSFSRTSLLVFFCLILVKGTQYPLKLIKILTVSIIALLISAIVLPSNTEYFLNKLFRSLTELSFTADKWDEWSIVNNWRGYEVYSAIRNYNNYNLFEQIAGKGFGAGISVFGYEYLVTGEDSLAMLHNGFYTILLKQGALGLTLNILYFLAMIRYCIKFIDISDDRLLSVSLVIALVLGTVLIMGPFWGGASFEITLILCWSRWKYSNGCVITHQSDDVI